jgi:hypothetical protein
MGLRLCLFDWVSSWPPSETSRLPGTPTGGIVHPVGHFARRESLAAQLPRSRKLVPNGGVEPTQASVLRRASACATDSSKRIRRWGCPESSDGVGYRRSRNGRAEGVIAGDIAHKRVVATYVVWHKDKWVSPAFSAFVSKRIAGTAHAPSRSRRGMAAC